MRGGSDQYPLPLQFGFEKIRSGPADSRKGICQVTASEVFEGEYFNISLQMLLSTVE